MRSGALDQEPGRGSARLVPQPDGYAEYVEQAREQARPAGPGQHRSSSRRPPGQNPTRNIPTGSFRIKGVQPPPRRGQRSIRTTITLLVILPVLTMIGLYLYAVSGTIGPAEAKQNAAKVNADIGAPFSAMVQQIEAEQADSYAWQASYHRDPQVNVAKDDKATDVAVAAFLAGDTSSQSVQSPQSKGEDHHLRTALASLQAIRAQALAPAGEGPAAGLVTFKKYLALQEAITLFSTGLANPNASIAENEESQVLIEAGTGTEDISDVATLLGGVLAGGGAMTTDEFKEFQTLYFDQQANFKEVNNPLYWQVSPDPYDTSVDGHPPAITSPQVKAVLKLEAAVNKAGSLTHPVKLSISPTQLEQAIGGAMEPPTGPLTWAEEVTRGAITANDNRQGDVILWRLAIVGGVGLLVVLLSTFLLLRFAQRITRELTRLRNAARTLAGERLPSVMQRLRAGDDVDVTAEAPPLDLKTRTREVSETADAFSAVQHTAIEATVEQAQLRKGVSNVFRSLARRNQSLVQRQLRMLDEMERGTQDPDALAQLFRLDHLTTRMRRQAEGLIILSGAAPGRRWRQPVSVVEALRGAISEIEDYVRVDLLTESPDYLTGAAVADVTHLLAELIENAVVYSPPATRVQVRGGRVANGYVIEIDDRGLGIPPAARDKLNERLAQPVEFDLADSDQLGLFVVSRLAVRNGIRVSLRESRFGSTTAIVLLPVALVVSEQEAAALSAQGARGAIPTSSRGADEAGTAESTITARRTPRLDRPVVAQDPQDSRNDQSFASRPSFGGQAYATSGSYPSPPSFGGGSSFGGQSSSRGQAAGDGQSYSEGGGQQPGTGSFGGSAFGGGNGGSAPLPTRGGPRGSFGNPAPFQDAPSPSAAPSSPAAPAAAERPPFNAGGDGGGQAAGLGNGGLPKREKMASLAPQLRDNRPETPQGPLPGRSPEQARALLSSIQRGLRTGREAGTASGAAGNDAGNGTANGDGAGDGTDGRGMK
ncbi:MAG: putative sensor with domain [Actinomycetia bacterium]|nr:putative sensor with domain [Actinomycetes bacterium]